ncbi:MAG: hypothetical protein ACFCGT_20755 [Sandaracinaceae bacterium]
MELRVRFDPPGVFVNDPRLTVRLDDRVVFEGSFRRGFLVSKSVVPGPHVIETQIQLGPSLARTRRYRFDVEGQPPPGYRGSSPSLEARLAYSRFTGNFRRRLSVRRV